MLFSAKIFQCDRCSKSCNRDSPLILTERIVFIMFTSTFVSYIKSVLASYRLLAMTIIYQDL